MVRRDIQIPITVLHEIRLAQQALMIGLLD